MATEARKTPDKCLRCLLALALVLSGLSVLLQGAARQAHAATATLVDTGDKFDFQVHDSSTGATWADSVFMIDGEYAYCIDITTTAYPGSSYSSSPMDEGTALKIGLYEKYLEGHHSDWSAYKRMGYLQYMIWCTYTPGYMSAYVTPEYGDFYGVFDAAKKFYQDNKDSYEATGVEWTSPNSQNMCTSVKVKERPGSIELCKTSARTEISGGNDCYGLGGATYTVYSDESCTEAFGAIVTDADGHGELGGVPRGGYWVKETVAATGYALDPQTYPVKVEAGKTAKVNSGAVSDEPQYGTPRVIVAKADASAGDVPQGDASLAGAQFVVDYYDGYYDSPDEAEQSGKQLRSWTFATDESGRALFDAEHKVAGDALYADKDGNPVIPLGTVVVEEVKAPLGYNLDDGCGNAPRKQSAQIVSDQADSPVVTTYHTPTAENSVKRGDYRLVKEVPVEAESESGIDQEQQRIVLEGVQFQIINASANPVVSPETGEEVSPGSIVCTIVTDEDGLATTKALGIPDDWTGALAFGSYNVHEVIPSSVSESFKAEHGCDLIPVDDWKITISDEGQYDNPPLVNNHIPQTPLKVVKVDAESGRQIPLPCSFQLVDADGNLATWTSHYPDEQVLDTWTTNANGEVTLPMLLEQGTYTITEAQAPEGYVLALEGKTVEVGSAYNNWDDPIVVTFEDMPQKGIINVTKTDSDNGEPVDDSVYVVKAATDIVTPDGTIRAKAGDIVATLETGKDGTASTGELYLGAYTVYEAKAKDGYALDVTEKTVALEYQGQEIDVFDQPVDVVDEPTEIKLRKVDALDPEKPVVGAKFHVWNDDRTFDDEMTTDENGCIEVRNATHGRWHIQETGSPEGYVINEVDAEGEPVVYDFTVNDQGMVELEDGAMTAALELSVENMPKTMKTTATDEANGTHESQAAEQMSIVDVVDYTGCIPGEEYTVSGTLMDKATGEAAVDHEGNAITSQTTFVAEGYNGTASICFTFNGVDLAGHDIVAFETMTHEGVEYMAHADIEDEGQTIKVIDIRTTAIDSSTNDNQGALDDELSIIDTVAFTNLTVGAEYTLTGTIMDKATGEPLLDADGDQIVSQATFIPEEPDGAAEVEFAIDSRMLAGKSIVVFEQLANAEQATVAKHEDIDDDGQTIRFAEISTSAADGADGDKNVLAGEKAMVIDTVTFNNLIPGKEYTVAGTLMDKETGEPLTDADGNEIRSSATFTPETAGGAVDVVFEFDATGFAEKTVVAFEALTKDGVEVAAHADIEDAAQTVVVSGPDAPDSPNPPSNPEEPASPKAGYPKTGAAVAGGILALVVCGGCAAALAARKGAKLMGRADDEEA
ncbi:VaFE repeat-containing surface-anchored protein [Adlercreutzia sp. ZJ473]|uniref:VaFE repeat-containing surface-anchored protein n=1 Tax=Adlercreutzia sp. ZJ473 TaxID=2722822 RepID=UPI001556AD9D|nr:VaFE repeat-containing surface-anchored protein [Adlercreutzia sp. ZJ473]